MKYHIAVFLVFCVSCNAFSAASTPSDFMASDVRGVHKKPLSVSLGSTKLPLDARQVYLDAAKQLARQEYHNRLLYKAYLRTQAEKQRIIEYRQGLLYRAYLKELSEKRYRAVEDYRRRILYAAYISARRR